LTLEERQTAAFWLPCVTFGGNQIIILVSLQFFHMEAKKEIHFDKRLLTFRWDATWMQKAAKIKQIKWADAKKKRKKIYIFFSGVY